MSHACWLSSHRCGRSVLPQRTSTFFAETLFKISMSGALSKVAVSGGECTDPVVLVPQSLIAQLNANRGICKFWLAHQDAKKKGKKSLPICRSGARCAFKHAMDDTMDCRMPYISWDRTKVPDGDREWMVVGSLRPPVTESVNAYIHAQGGQKESFKLLGGAHSIIFFE